METINIKPKTIKYYKKIFRKSVSILLRKEINEKQAVCLSAALISKKATIKLLLLSIIDQKKRDGINELLNVLEKLGLTSNPVKKSGFYNDFADFCIFSGYLESGLLLKNTIKKNFPDKNFPELEDLPETRYPKKISLKIIKSKDKNESAEIKNIPINSENLNKAIKEICTNKNIDNEDLILFGYSEENKNLSSAIKNQTNRSETDADLFIFHKITDPEQPFNLRKPERLYSFAVRKSLLSKISELPYLRHPIIILAALWHCAADSGKIKKINCTTPCEINDDQRKIPAEAYIFDRLTTRVFSDMLWQQNGEIFEGFLNDLPYSKYTHPKHEDIQPETINIANILPRENTYDVLMATDFRIRGGGVKSVLEEISILKEYGYKVGVLHLDAITLKKLTVSFAGGTFSKLSALNVPILNGMTNIQAKATIVRYPPTLSALPEIKPTIDTGKLIIVINQPPKRLQSDTPFYDPIMCHQNAEKLFNATPTWWPNGEDARLAMDEYTQDIPLSETNWLNVISTFSEEQTIENRIERLKDQKRAATLGRHTRDVVNKWPSDARKLLQCYPDDNSFTVNILGGANRAKKILKTIPANWNIWEYGTYDVQEYLRELDFFVFFPHEERIEPMARCIVEAMSTGLPVILPNKFKNMYGKSPVYCNPEEVIPIMKQYIEDIEQYKAKSYETLKEAKEIYGPESLIKRLKTLGIKPQ